MALKFAIGALAKLNSGGPSMTVVKDRTDGSSKHAEFAWFDGTELRQAVLHKDAVNITHEAPAKAGKTTAATAAPAASGGHPDAE